MDGLKRSHCNVQLNTGATLNCIRPANSCNFAQSLLKNSHMHVIFKLHSKSHFYRLNSTKNFTTKFFFFCFE